MTAELAAQVMSAPSFESVQELGEAWHTVAGYPRELLSDASIVSLLELHPHFAHRCAKSTPSLFFGPNKERLWDVVRREYCEPALAASARQRECGSFPVTTGKRSSSCLSAKGILARILAACLRSSTMMLSASQQR